MIEVYKTPEEFKESWVKYPDQLKRLCDFHHYGMYYPKYDTFEDDNEIKDVILCIVEGRYAAQMHIHQMSPTDDEIVVESLVSNGGGLGGRLMEYLTTEMYPYGTLSLKTGLQGLVGYYERFGFEMEDPEEYSRDDPFVPMIRY